MRIYCGYKKDNCDLFEKLSDEELLEFKKGLDYELKIRRLISKDSKVKVEDSKN